MANLRTAALQIAAELPAGDPTRRKLLEALDKRARLDGSAFPKGSYFNVFFNEKGLASKDYKVKDSQGVMHFIPAEVVLESLAQTRGGEKAQAEDILRKIDFHNGDVHDFLQYLAKALAEQYAGVLR